MGVLMYSCDLPTSHQTLISDILLAIAQQEECNKAIDKVVDQEVTAYSAVFRAKRQRLSQTIRRYLELTIADTSSFITNCTGFYRYLAVERESHLKQEQALRKLTHDELLDCSENSRTQLLDLEAEYSDACKYGLH